MSANPPPDKQPLVPRAATLLESEQEIRQAIQARQDRLRSRPPADSGPSSSAAAEAEAQPYRPRVRPPLALLCILDDGKHDGEWLRLRGDRYVLGRTDGDIRIPHDGLMSSRHAELSRQKVQGAVRWVLTDLGSTNGTLVRVGSTVLRDGWEVQVGRGRYRFEAADRETTAAEPAVAGTTRPWQSEGVHAQFPALVELAEEGGGRRFLLRQAESWLGRDPGTCAIARPDDPLTNPRHARLYRDAKGQWHIANHKSLNGVWLRLVQPQPIETACQFQLGEQRFLLRVL